MQKFKVSSEMQAEPLKQTPEEPKSKLQPFDVKWSGLNIAIAEEERKARPKPSGPNTKFCSLVSHILANSAITWAPAGLHSQAQGPLSLPTPLSSLSEYTPSTKNAHHPPMYRICTTYQYVPHIRNIHHLFRIHSIHSGYAPVAQNTIHSEHTPCLSG